MSYSTLFDASRPAIHMVLQVNLPDGPYIADVGFGNLAPTRALRLELELGTPHEHMRFVAIVRHVRSGPGRAAMMLVA